VQARVGRGRRENKTRNNEVVWYLLYTKSTYVVQLAEQTVCSREEWLKAQITPPFMAVCTQTSNSFILGGTVFLGVGVPVELRRGYAGFVKPLTKTGILGPHKYAAQFRK